VSVIDPGAGAPAPGAPAPAAGTGPAPTQTQPPPQPTADDPWGFASHLANAPEQIRPSLQPILDGIGQQLQERFAPYQQLESRMDRIAPLLAEPDENGNTTLDGLITLFDLFNDPDKAEDFQDWWEAVGQEFEFFDDEPGGGQQRAAAAPEGDQGVDLSTLDPAARAIIEQLQGTVQGLESRLGEFETRDETTQREQAVSAAAEQIETERGELMKQHRINGAGEIQSQESKDILKLAGAYGADPKAVEKGVQDYLRITGGAQSQQLEQNGQQLSGVDALRAALAGGGNAPAHHQPGPALGPGGAPSAPEDVRSFDDAKTLALQRFTTAHGGGGR
jgi:hypothetical protein